MSDEAPIQTTQDADPPAASEHRETEYSIVINGELAVVPHQEVSYEEAVSIAYPVPPRPDVTNYTVTFRDAEPPRHEGVLAPGEVVKVKVTGTKFNVTPTGKA